jgi:hypothetical protein
MNKILIIEDCSCCIYCGFGFCLNPNLDGVKDKLLFKHKEKYIPYWCPLDDADEKSGLN